MVIRNKGHLFRLIGLHSMILIHMLILLPYLQKLPEQLQPLRLQLPGIHQLLVVLPPGAHIALLRHKLGGLAVISFQEVDRFLPFCQPEFVLGHCLFHACHQLPQQCRVERAHPKRSQLLVHCRGRNLVMTYKQK